MRRDRLCRGARGARGGETRPTASTAAALRTAKAELELLWEQVSVVVVDTELVRAAGDVAEHDALGGYDAVHMAAAIAGQVTVVASADRRLVEAAGRRGFAVAQPS